MELCYALDSHRSKRGRPTEGLEDPCPVCCFSMMVQVRRLCDVRPTENWLGSSMNHIQGWLDDCLRMLLSCLRKRMSDLVLASDVADIVEHGRYVVFSALVPSEIVYKICLFWLLVLIFSTHENCQ